MFFKDTEDFRECFPVSASFSFERLESFLRIIDSSILVPFLGNELVDDLQTKYNKYIQTDFSELPEKITGKYAELLKLVRVCTSNYAILKWVPTGLVHIDESGIKISTSETLKPAFEWQVNKAESSILNSSIIGLEDILLFLEKNIADFPLYKNSGAYKNNRSLFVPTAAEMVRHYSAMNTSRVNYFLFKSIFKKVEDFEIKSVLLPNLFKYLKDKLSAGTDLTPADKELIENIQPALVHLTIARAINELAATVSPDGFLIFDNTTSGASLNKKKSAPNSTLERMQLAASNDGKAYLSLLKEFLEANKSTYTQYANDPLYKTYTSGVPPQNSNNNFYSGL